MYIYMCIYIHIYIYIYIYIYTHVVHIYMTSKCHVPKHFISRNCPGSGFGLQWNCTKSRQAMEVTVATRQKWRF